jgi:cytochrome oxidase Cu insertion factor (SCO1/SenC/PrrC family)
MMLAPSFGETIMSNLNHRQTVRNRLTLVSIALVAALPAVLSFLLYTSGWRPSSSGNYGELVEPPRAIKNLEFQTLNGNRLRVSDLSKRWAFVYFVADGCGAACEHSLYKMRQVRLTQGENAKRLQRVLVVVDNVTVEKLRIQLGEYPGMVVITGPRENVRTLSEEFVLPTSTPFDGSGRIYLLDPAGRLMMSYPADADPNGMRKDLKRLLKVSQIG